MKFNILRNSGKQVNTKSVVLTNCRKISYQQKSLKPKRIRPKAKKNLAELGAGQEFLFCFGLPRTRAEILIYHSGWDGTVKSGPCISQSGIQNNLFIGF